MGEMRDIMVDLETTGTSSHDHNGIIQLAGIKWNFETGEIGGMFDQAPELLANRFWDEDTREFWMKKNVKIYDGIIARRKSAIEVYGNFIQWVRADAPEGGYRFWSKPLHFDWSLLASHINQMGAEMPFFYRTARDVNSVCAGLLRRMEHPNMEAIVSNDGDVHNALHDCAFQIECVLAAKGGLVQ